MDIKVNEQGPYLDFSISNVGRRFAADNSRGSGRTTANNHRCIAVFEIYVRNPDIIWPKTLCQTTGTAAPWRAPV